MATQNEIIHNRTQVYLGWRERIRVLFGNCIHVDVDIEIAQTEVVIVKTRCHTWVEPILPRRQVGGYVITERATPEPEEK